MAEKPSADELLRRARETNAQLQQRDSLQVVVMKSEGAHSYGVVKQISRTVMSTKPNGK
jgi:hypothetical protein